MRKAGVALRGATKSRRKEKQQHEQQSSSLSSSPQQHIQQQQQQSATSNGSLQPEDFAAITAKNYRLAKELSELRVRHREECRNVTRLSMDNINLASKCRDTMAQVRALKAEVRAHRQRLRDVASAASNNNGAAADAANRSAASSPASTSASVSPKSTDDTLLLSSRSSMGGVDQLFERRQLHADTNEMEGNVTVPPAAAAASPVAAATGAAASMLSPPLQQEMDRMDRILAEHARQTVCITEEPSLEAATTTDSSLLSVPEDAEVGHDGDVHENAATEELEHALAEQPQATEENAAPDPNDADVSDTNTRQSSHQSNQQQTAATSINKPLLVSSDDFEEDVRFNQDGDAFSKDDDEGEAYDSASPLAMPGWETQFSPSPQFKFYDEEYPQDISSVSVRSSKDSADHYSLSQQQLGEVQEEEVVGGGNHDLSSMDAFEASFAITAFPESFSPKEQERHLRDLKRRAARRNGRNNNNATAAASESNGDYAPVRRDFTNSPPPTNMLGEAKSDDYATTTTAVYDPFTHSPKHDETSNPLEPPTQSIPIEPLVIKWGTRARDRMRGTTTMDPPAALYGSNNGKKLSVRQVLDLSSSSADESNQYPATTATTPVSSKTRNGSDGVMQTPSPTSVSSASAAGKSYSSPSKEKKPLPAVSWDGVRSILPFNSKLSSPRKATSLHSHQDGPSTPTQASRYATESDAYSTPPSSAASNSLQNSGESYASFEPPRPQKTGYDVARAKYEKATRPRQNQLDADATNNVMPQESAVSAEELSITSSPTSIRSGERNGRLSADAHVLATVSVKDRAAAYLASSPPQDAPLTFEATYMYLKQRPGPSYDDSDGDIPLNTSLSKSKSNHAKDDDRLGDSDDELSSPKRQVWEEDIPPYNSFDADREAVDVDRPYDPYELESQLKRPPPPQSQLGMNDAPLRHVYR
ncbi:hypothetical protein MPSEU_000010100 [Mayamaea pseudoterrestris]|nr:hypothetical protein MPSEU_000010100 [Mayamaea pseudoterrestris]